MEMLASPSDRTSPLATELSRDKERDDGEAKWSVGEHLPN
jgi:hypothetical protein